jgi:phospholipid-translocating ATPase
MSFPHQYYHQNAPDPADDESDSDLELTLNELDPASSAISPGASRLASNPFDFGTRIPLRNLRPGRIRKHSEVSADGEDTLGLLENTSDNRFGDEERGATGHLTRPTLSSDHKKSGIARLKDLLFSDVQQSSPNDEPEDDHDPSSNRTILVGHRQTSKFPANAVSNSRYTAYDFIPRTLYNEFKFFINLYFLFVALSQIIPALRIGYLSSYIVPLAAVLTITLGKEAWDDVSRRRRDAEANSEPFTVLRIGPPNARSKAARKRMKGKMKAGTNGQATGNGSINGEVMEVQEITKPSKDLKVGDIVKLSKNQRVPADLVILKSVSADAQALDLDDLTTEEDNNSGEAFIRTDQLDGETDWKLRLASPLTQKLPFHLLTKLKVTAGKPDRKVNDFVGTIEMPKIEYDETSSDDTTVSPLSVDNTAWANTVLASSSTLYGVVIYTGSQTRQAMSLTQSRPKVGLLELEINNLTKILCGLTFSISLILVLLGRIEHGKERPWYIGALRFLILFSTVIPISLRVNLDMGKIVYAWYIEHDNEIPDTVVRTSTIPEDLGRVEYLLSDKTGTLTQNGKSPLLFALAHC